MRFPSSRSRNILLIRKKTQALHAATVTLGKEDDVHLESLGNVVGVEPALTEAVDYVHFIGARHALEVSAGQRIRPRFLHLPFLVYEVSQRRLKVVVSKYNQSEQVQ
mgnify:CR=1 FL=1